jgi:hypothetical protein
LFDTGLYVLLVDASRFEPIEIAISGDEDITVGRDVLEPISISPVSRVVAPTVRREDIVPQVEVDLRPRQDVFSPTVRAATHG